jgi:hypothetical protein
MDKQHVSDWFERRMRYRDAICSALGKKDRSQIGEGANKGAAYMKERGEAVCGLVDQGKDEVVRQAEDVVEAVKRRAQDYKKAVS